MNDFSESLYIQVAEPSLFIAMFLGLPQASFTWSIVIPTARRWSSGRLSLGFFGGWLAALFVEVSDTDGWAAVLVLLSELEAQPHNTAIATVETNTPMSDIFLIV
jgi:hypothetical protein